MTPESLKAWRERLFGIGYGTRSKQKAAQSLGLSQRAYDSYEAGEHRIPRYIELACAALSYHHTAIGERWPARGGTAGGNANYILTGDSSSSYIPGQGGGERKD